jgi:hypothetical protein
MGAVNKGGAASLTTAQMCSTVLDSHANSPIG